MERTLFRRASVQCIERVLAGLGHVARHRILYVTIDEGLQLGGATAELCIRPATGIDAVSSALKLLRPLTKGYTDFVDSTSRRIARTGVR